MAEGGLIVAIGLFLLFSCIRGLIETATSDGSGLLAPLGIMVMLVVYGVGAIIGFVLTGLGAVRYYEYSRSGRRATGTQRTDLPELNLDAGEAQERAKSESRDRE